MSEKLDYQKEVLKLYCINANFAVNYGSLIKPEYFDTSVLKILYGIISNYVTVYEKPLEDKNIFYKEITEVIVSRGYGNDIENSLYAEAKDIFDKNTNNEQHLIDKFLDFCRYQELKNAIIKSVEVLKEGKDYEKVLKLVDQAVSVGAGYDEGYSWKDIYDIQDKMKVKYSPESLVKTGIPTFDTLLMGGMGPGEVHVVQAIAKTGKSHLGVNMGYGALLDGKSVFHISLELPKDDVMQRYAIRSGKFSFQDFYDMPKDELAQRLEYLEKYHPNLYVMSWPQKSVTTLTLRSWISRIRYKTGRKPDFIIVDYDDCLIPIAGRKSDMYEEGAEIYFDLAGLANYFQCPVLTFAQPNRGAVFKSKSKGLIGAEDMAHSWRKAHIANSISSMNFNPGDAEGILYIERMRRGRDGVEIPIYRDLSKCLIKEIEGLNI